MRRLDEAVAPVAVDAVARDQVLDQRLRLLGEAPEAVGIVAAEMRLEPVLVAPLAGMELPAVPARSPPADPLGLDQRDIDTGLGEMQRRRQAGIAAADDRDMGLDRLVERRKGERRVGCAA